MKIFRVSFIISLFLLCSLQGTSNTLIHTAIDNEYDIEQSPLSDDETNPLSANSTEVATIDVEDSDENNSDFTNLKVTSFVKSKFDFLSFISSTTINSYKQHFYFTILHSPQSYLQVFRI